MAKRNPQTPAKLETTGHEWDGITEANRPLPKWWLWTFYACIVWAIGYWLLMPAWPRVSGYTKGVLGYSQRESVAEQVADGEAVADPFAGVGPYAILIAKRRRPTRVVASDANPAAVDLLRRNVAANHVDRVDVREGDARVVLRAAAPLDRIILDLPHSSMDFLPDALAALGPRGIIHVYGILEDADRDDRVRAIRETAEARGGTVEAIRVHVVRAYAPTQHHVAFDVTVGPR